MSLALKQAGESKAQIEQRIAKATRMLNLQEYLHRFPSELSGGQRQRVAIGRAIVREPSLFLFDEPLSNLDAALRINTRIEIANLHKQLSTAMVYVTHDQTEAMTLADKIVVLRDGVVEQSGTPMELYNNPRNRFVAGFLGSPSMNFMPANFVNPGNEHTLGIRPEDLKLEPGGRINAVVNHVEQLGGDTNLIVDVEQMQLTVRLFGQHEVQENSAIRLDFAAEKAFYFDSSGQRV